MILRCCERRWISAEHTHLEDETRRSIFDFIRISQCITWGSEDWNKSQRCLKSVLNSIATLQTVRKRSIFQIDKRLRTIKTSDSLWFPNQSSSGYYGRVGFLPTVTSRQTSRMIKIGIRVAFQSILIHFWLLQNLPSAFVNRLWSIFNYPPQTNIANFIHSESVVRSLSPRRSIPEFFCSWGA